MPRPRPKAMPGSSSLATISELEALTPTVPPPRCRYELATLGYRQMGKLCKRGSLCCDFLGWDNRVWGHPPHSELDDAFHEWASVVDGSRPWEFMRCLELADPAAGNKDLRGDFPGITSFFSGMDAARLGTNEGRHCPQSFASAALLAISTIDLEALSPTVSLQFRFS